MGKSCKVVVCGQASVGKTSILEQLLYGNHVVGECCSGWRIGGRWLNLVRFGHIMNTKAKKDTSCFYTLKTGAAGMADRVLV